MLSTLSRVVSQTATAARSNSKNLSNALFLRGFAVQVINSADDVQSLLQKSKDKVVVIDWYGTWCGPCMRFASKYEELSNRPQYSDVVFSKADVDRVDCSSLDLPEINSVPTFFILKDGRVINAVLGADQARLEEAIKSASSK